MMRFTPYLIAVGMGGAVLGCTPDDRPWFDALDVAQPIATDRSLVFQDRSRDELLFARPVAGSLELARRTIGTDADQIAWMQTTVRKDAVLLMNVAADAKQEDVTEQLIRIDSATLTETVYEVGAPFSNIALSEDGRYGVLYFDGSNNVQPLQNVNQAAIVDFEAPNPTAAVRLITLDGFGGRVEQILFPENAMGIEVGGVSRDLAVFTAAGEAVIVDLADPNVNETQVAFRFDTSPNFTPVKVLARPADDLMDIPAMFFLSSNDADVTMLSLVEKPNPEDELSRFTVQPGLLPVGKGATDLELYDSGDVPYAITLRGSEARFTDVLTQSDFVVDFGAPVEQGFLRTTEVGDVPSTELVAWEYGGAFLYGLELQNIESALGRTPSLHKVENGVGGVFQVNNAKVLVEGLSDAFEFYVVDFDRDLVAPLYSSVPFDLSRSFLFGNRLLIGAPGYDVMSTIDLETLDTQNIVLDAQIQSLQFLTAGSRAIAVHGDNAGYITDVDARNLARSSASAHWGFFLQDDYNRDGEGQ